MARRFNPPPNWPTPQEGWTPPPGWEPPEAWPKPPYGWNFWTDDSPHGPVPPPEPAARKRGGRIAAVGGVIAIAGGLWALSTGVLDRFDPPSRSAEITDFYVSQVPGERLAFNIHISTTGYRGSELALNLAGGCRLEEERNPENFIDLGFSSFTPDAQEWTEVLPGEVYETLGMPGDQCRLVAAVMTPERDATLDTASTEFVLAE